MKGHTIITMGSIVVHNGTLSLSGCGPYTLPERITMDVVYALFRAAPGEEGFIGELATYIEPEEKTRLRNACRRIGGKAWQDYCSAAIKWAAVANPDNKWNLRAFNQIYVCDINSHWARQVIITDKGIRFVTTPRGVFTFPEFKWIYEVDLIQHLESFKDEFVQRVTDLKRHMSADVVRRSLVVMDSQEKVCTKKFVGLASLPLNKWVLPPGYTFVADPA